MLSTTSRWADSGYRMTGRSANTVSSAIAPNLWTSTTAAASSRKSDTASKQGRVMYKSEARQSKTELPGWIHRLYLVKRKLAEEPLSDGKSKGGDASTAVGRAQ